MRGFLCSKEVSSQLGREFKNQHYNDMKKVYSIWVCMNTRENSLNKIALKNENVFGQSRWKDKYDMIHIVTIRLSRKMDEDRGMNCIVFLEQSLHMNCHFRRKKNFSQRIWNKVRGRQEREVDKYV